MRRDARARVLLTGDSFVYGISDVLGRFLKAHRGSLTADPNPGSGITKPAVLDWAAHALRSASGERPDVSIVFLGVADGFPLVIAGEPVACCGPAWGDEYVRRVDRMMTAYLRDGRGLVYWALLPTPRDPAMAEIFSAVNARAAAGRRGASRRRPADRRAGADQSRRTLPGDDLVPRPARDRPRAGRLPPRP